MSQKVLPDERIAVAAVRQDGEIFSLPRPGRHCNVIALMVKKGFPIPITGENGFLTEGGRFVGREEAMKIALEADQLLSRANPEARKLTSEDVWMGYYRDPDEETP